MAHYLRWAHIQRRAGPPVKGPPPPGAHPQRYEGYGPGGTAILIDSATADPGATQEALRRALGQHGGHLGAPGAVGYLFNPVGLIAYPPGTERGSLTQAAFDVGAEEVVETSDQWIEILADPRCMAAVRERLAVRGFPPAYAEVTERAWDAIPLSGEAARSLLRLLLKLQGRGDVRNLYSNAEILEEIVAEL